MTSKNRVSYMKSKVMQNCEYDGCKQKATQADTYINAWLCDKHYSKIGTLTNDYQANHIDWDHIENLVIPKVAKLYGNIHTGV